MNVLHGGFILPLLLLLPGALQAAKVSDVANTKHNLSMNWGGNGVDPRTITSTSEARICVFCHTPHGANTTAPAPLWNRKLAGDVGYTPTYTMYDSSSMESSALAGAAPAGPTNSSKLCLSCHDGVIAIGAVNVLNGTATTLTMNGTIGSGEMPNGSYGATSGNTRNIGTDLSNDHPISITYNSTLVTADGELSDPLSSPHVGVRGPGVNPLIPLVPDPLDGNKPKLECVSCHDPHIRDTTDTDIKFLRLNRFQANNDPVGQGGNPNLVNFNESNDIICLACHNKEGWVDSAHASELVANEAYNNTAASERDFPLTIQVWQAACLNCHDTHTVAGSRRLLREGTTDTPPNGQVIKAGGGTPAIEETCYQCHSSDADPYYALNGTNPQVPNIKSDFQLARHMPISSAEQAAGSEVHNIGNTGISGDGKDFIENQLTLGKGNLMNRHAECTDCHNPHRVTKNRLATDAPSNPAAAGTHDHNLTDGAVIHTNLISGVLRGTWGVEPVYSNTAFTSLPINYIVKKGVPPQNGSTLVTENYVTREYQVCLKCHSDYGFDDVNPPALGDYAGGTPYGTNGLTHYTNQAMEFQAPSMHQGEGTAANSGSAAVSVATGYVFRQFTIPASYQPANYSLAASDCYQSYAAINCVCTSMGSMSPATLEANGFSNHPNTYNYYTAFLDPSVPADVATYAMPPSGGLVGSSWDGITLGFAVHRCEKTDNYSIDNHRGWHPVMAATGRDAVTRGNMLPSNFLGPFSAGVGTQTMYCSDCHGSNTAQGTVEPDGGEDGNPWGPHGSNNNFILKGIWSDGRGNGDVPYSPYDQYLNPYSAPNPNPTLLCLRCHDQAAYASGSTGTIYPSGFSVNASTDMNSWGSAFVGSQLNLHQGHYQKLGSKRRGFKCTFCHTAVPHGWKNKALLVNLNDVGPEVGLPVGTAIFDTIPSTDSRRYTSGYTKAPYYIDARLRITNFKTSGNWDVEDCGGVWWMMDSCQSLP